MEHVCIHKNNQIWHFSFIFFSLVFIFNFKNISCCTSLYVVVVLFFFSSLQLCIFGIVHTRFTLFGIALGLIVVEHH
jgi:hypothetical protein